MSASGGMSQLLKGIIIGVVLIMAIIGTMSLLNKGDLQSVTQNSSQSSAEISAPAITLNPQKSTNTANSNDGIHIGNLNADLVDTDKDSTSTPETSNANSAISETETKAEQAIKPVLEGEKTAVEIAKQQNPISYGMMELSAINPLNNQALKANYIVFDKDNKKVAESNNASKTSYRLATGQYKVETSLTRTDAATNQVIPVISKSRYMIVRANSTARQTFELEPPPNTGVLQVSAKINDQIVRANFIIQKENGEVVASRNNVTNSLFKLDSGTYKVTVSNGNNKDFRSVEVKAGESTQSVFILKEAARQGKLLVRIFDTNSSNPIRADIVITNTSGSVIQNIKSSTKTELSLAPGVYKISVTGPNGSSNKNIQVSSGQTLNEIFRFDAATATLNTETAQTEAQTSTQTNNNQNSTQINENVAIRPVTTEATDIDNSNKTGSLKLIALDELSKRPMKSNFYIQTPAGKHLDKKIYADTANFTLKPGTYKVTVRATNRNNSVKTIQVIAGQHDSATFLLSNPNKQQAQNNRSPKQNVSAPAKTVTVPKAIATGFLNVSMQGAENPNSLRSHFIVTTTAGKKIVELTSVQQGNFKLDVGTYMITAIHNNKRRKQQVSVRANQNTRLAFSSKDFSTAKSSSKGVLRSRIVDETGRPLKGNLIVSTINGQIVARANNVSNASFNLAPIKHKISIDFQGLSGSEVVNISANETTVQTFTIAPNRNSPPPNTDQQNPDSKRDIKDILKDKLKEELRKQF